MPALWYSAALWDHLRFDLQASIVSSRFHMKCLLPLCQARSFTGPEEGLFSPSPSPRIQANFCVLLREGEADARHVPSDEDACHQRESVE
jgi:hypothetical protein